MIRVKPDWVLATRSLGSLDARAKARWVLGSQGPGFPGEENEETIGGEGYQEAQIKSSWMSQSG